MLPLANNDSFQNISEKHLSPISFLMAMTQFSIISLQLNNKIQK